jgi:hypothetical protein
MDIGDEVEYHREAPPGVLNPAIYTNFNGSSGIIKDMTRVMATVFFNNGTLKDHHYREAQLTGGSLITVKRENLRLLWKERPYNPEQEPDDEDDV